MTGSGSGMTGAGDSAALGDIGAAAVDEQLVGRQVRRYGRFLRRHGGPGRAVPEYLGESGTRLVVIAADGAFLDCVLVAGAATAAAICDRAGIPVEDWSRELTAAVTVTEGDRRRMAGTGR